ncbi:MAG: hypothetical protein IIC90_00450 [Chloroflexi bacterium]|nr:hypothetical protein [Chloroflexota bacterium]
MSVDNKNTFSPNQTTPSKPVSPALRAAEGRKRKPRRVPSGDARRSKKRLNALVHGITSNSPVIPGMEDEAAWKRHCDGIVASIEPVGGLEECLAQRVASLLWRLNRVLRYEVAVTMHSIDGTADALLTSTLYQVSTNLPTNVAKEDIIDPGPEVFEDQRELRILPPDPYLERIAKHERHFHRQFLQTLHEIEALQARRKGHSVNLARVDFSGSPAA